MRRVDAAREGYYAMEGVWGRRGVGVDVIRGLFKGVVVSALLSGMEAEAPTAADLRLLEGAQCKYGRMALGSRGSREVRGVRRQLSDEEVRRRLGLATVESELRARRLKWWQGVTEDRGNNVQLRAALFGTMRRETREGVILGPCPWMQLLMQDMGEFAEVKGCWGGREGVRELFEEQGFQSLLGGDWLARAFNLEPGAVRTAVDSKRG